MIAFLSLSLSLFLYVVLFFTFRSFFLMKRDSSRDVQNALRSFFFRSRSRGRGSWEWRAESERRKKEEAGNKTRSSESGNERGSSECHGECNAMQCSHRRVDDATTRRRTAANRKRPFPLLLPLQSSLRWLFFFPIPAHHRLRPDSRNTTPCPA